MKQGLAVGLEEQVLHPDMPRICRGSILWLL